MQCRRMSATFPDCNERCVSRFQIHCPGASQDPTTPEIRPIENAAPCGVSGAPKPWSGLWRFYVHARNPLRRTRST